MERHDRTSTCFGSFAWLAIVLTASELVIACVGIAQPYTLVDKTSGRSIPIPAHGTSLGDPKASVVIDEYSDFQCPFCKEYTENVESRILKEYVASGKVRIIYHAFGNWVSRKAEGNTESERTAEAAYFAADYNRFWQLHDLFFALQGRPNSGVFSNEKIIESALQVSLDGKKLSSSLASKAYAGQVQKEYDQGIARGVTSTPTFFVNGHMIVGAQPYEVFKSVIDDALGVAGKTAKING